MSTDVKDELELTNIDIANKKLIVDTMLTIKKLAWFEATIMLGAIGIGIAIAKVFL